MTTQTMMRISYERKLQLEEFAQALGGKSMNEAVGKLIQLAREQGLVEHSIPGVYVRVASDGLVISFADGKHVPFSRDGAECLVSTIREFVDGVEAGKCVINMDHDFEVTRRGGAIKVSMPIGDTVTKTWAPDIALDFAALIEAQLAAIKA